MTDICAIIERETGQSVTADTELEALPLDSLEFLELTLKIEDATGRSVENRKLFAAKTVGDIARLFEAS